MRRGAAVLRWASACSHDQTLLPGEPRSSEPPAEAAPSAGLQREALHTKLL